MQWIRVVVGALCAATAVSCASPQAIFQVQGEREPDLVDLMVDEARTHGIPLDNELRPTSAEAQGGSFSWTQCGGDNFAVRVESIELSPEAPERGRNLTVHGKGTLSRRADVRRRADPVWLVH